VIKLPAQEFAHRLLISLARQIREGKDLDREKIVEWVLTDSLDKNDSQYDFWKTRIKKRLDYLLAEEDEEALLVRLIEDACSECPENAPCAEVCPTGAIKKDEEGKYRIREDLCVECTLCVENCISGSIITRSEFAQVASMILQSKEHPVYAIVAPSFVGQFGENVTPEIFKGALKEIGFTDVYEVALAADIITHHEAEIFVDRIKKGQDFVITSCCCPAFIKLVEKIRPRVSHLVTPSVSPMIALGRILKKREPNCRVVFIGPCIAKKAEAKRPDLQPAIDCVLTYKETKALLEAGDIPLDGSLGQEEMKDASHDGRIYAFTGGVTAAITRAVKRLSPHLEVKAVYGDGLKECNRLLKEYEEGNLDANFMEGMGCPHGCVGGPGTIIHSELAKKIVQKHAREALYAQAMDNTKAKEWQEQYGEATDLHSKKVSLK